MDVIVVYSGNKDELTALKAVMKAMKITFEQKSEYHPDYVVNGVKDSLKQAEEGKLTAYTGIKNMLDKPHLQQKQSPQRSTQMLKRFG